MSLATAEAIRDRVYTLMEALAVSGAPKLIRYRNEGGARFDDWAEKNPTACLRRFQVREVGDDAPPETTSASEEYIRLHLEIRIAYPQNHRVGPANAMDRDDMMNADWSLINSAIGIYGRANFSGANDCTPFGATKTREQGAVVDAMVVSAVFGYFRAVS